jgi:hypothetical protein
MLRQPSYFLCTLSSIPAVLALTGRPTGVCLTRFNVNIASSSFFMGFAPCGTLLEVVNAKKRLAQAEAEFYFKSMFFAVHHLHCTTSWRIAI